MLVGFSPKEWERITDIQILKRSGEHHVDKMRCIQLLDAEMNMCQNFLGKLAFARAEETKTVQPEQHGSRKNHKAINACLNKQLLMDTFRLKRRAGAIAMLDMKGCFDRMVHTILILVLMSYACLW